MLKTLKSTTLTGQSKVTLNENEVIAVQLSANITESGTSNIVSTIVNRNAYEANKTSCRADIDQFTKQVRNLEDSNIEENNSESEHTTDEE